MIRVDSLTIKEFRGIRDLTLDFKEKNFVICGHNGTGKSGVVDALEFALTGNVSRLSGEGKGDVSLKQHGPHVDMRKDPDKARVTVKFTITSLGKTVTVERSVKNPTTVQVIPKDEAVLEVLQKVESHPEIVLSRRELIRYVLATPGDRAKEVQALLHLDQVEMVRVRLQKIANTCEKQLVPLGTAVTSAKENLMRALELSELSVEKILAAVNAQRTILGLPILTDLTGAITLKDGIATPTPAKSQSIPKIQALADIRAAREVLEEIVSPPTKFLVTEVLTCLQDLACDPEVAASVKRESFYTTGVELIDTGECPFCDTSWELDKLKDHIQSKIEHLKEVSLRRKAAEKRISPLIATLSKAHLSIDTLVRYSMLTAPSVNIVAARDYSASCKAAANRLTILLPLAETITVLNSIITVPKTVLGDIVEFEKVISALPEPTKQDAAREWLTVVQERLEVLRDAMQKQKNAQDQTQMARQVSGIYNATSDRVLTEIYEAVEKDFAALYGFINRDDEDKFRAKLIPTMGKLGFDVDFYGRGFFPPGAYHSEGHQDSMGLCLYLALMRYLQGAGFTFAVLDDVLMSVDAGHRREVCALLKREFPNTQFIMTTHDPVWMRHMKTERLVDGRSAVQFRNWNVNSGPAGWDARDIWTEIEDYCEKNNVRAAAALLRHYLEYESAELCHRLRASVAFRGDAQYQLGELLPSATSRMRKLFQAAKKAANSWNQKEAIEQLSVREVEFTRLAETSKVEQWQVNVAVHYNSWDSLCKSDFEPVVTAFSKLLNAFKCPDCGDYLRVSPDRETPESVRCECGRTNFNLCEKGTN